ncbi:L-fucose mutarotase [Blastocystis sp. subtype 4]|uniref:L-fucose mutarotase n=1 Tax=Blastocystis sp. subtype 4 TaxID=944170 RepID=UPI0007112F44|nr:L-fucose mutarotase [Blastocystis sp. subtype 4]KNB45129.1 L-fucose mutarotase [Blastocystis sp. subtype 4]|eukprot:XP_014528567.1 L-fucose mutarotase [Blastocystis sp. subtype 4]
MPILKGVSSCISPELLKVLAEMGHSDQIVIADANFPAASIASHCPGGHDIPRILRGICKLLPLDQYVDCPAQVMAKMECDKDMEIPIIDEYVKIMSEAENREVEDWRVINVEYVERFEFYERAKKCYAVIATGETSQYANIILQKGVITNPEY